MTDFRCEACARSFSSEEGLKQHNRDKHSIGGPQPKHELRQIKKLEKERLVETEKKKVGRSKLIKRGIYVIVPVIFITAVLAFVFSQPPVTGNSIDAISASDIPKGPIHWHPELEIVINGQKQIIPANLGATGAAHHPIHTHDSTGVLHYEHSTPTPENMPLKYFFDKVWRKQFNSTCVLEYCNSDLKSVKMFVNGKENFEFENYIPKDKDKIRIEFN